MSTWKSWLLLSVILVFALALRWTGIDWDGYLHYHPDERYITWVATTIEWPDDWRSAFIPNQSSFNPFYWPAEAESSGIEVPQDQPRAFAYGHFPLYLGVASTRFVEWFGPAIRDYAPQDWAFTTDVLNTQKAIEYRHLTAVSRALTGLIDTATILVLFLLGRRIFNTAVGLLAAAFLAVNVMHIQLSHFFTADPYLAFFTVAAVYFMVRAVMKGYLVEGEDMGMGDGQNKRRFCHSPACNLLLAALFIGLAVGSKFSAVMLGLPLVIALWFSIKKGRLRLLLATALIAFLIFSLTNPFTLLDFGCEVLTPATQIGPFSIPALDWRSCYLQNIVKQGSMVRGELDLGFTRQYAGTIPYLYPLEMQLRWGMGWLLGLLAVAGFGWAVWQAAKTLWPRAPWREFSTPVPLAAKSAALIVLVAWTVPFFLTTGGFYVKFMRYLLPMTPFLMLYAAAMLWGWRFVVGRWIVIGVVFIGTTLYALSFSNIYQEDHPWDLASRWVYENIEPGTLIASEQWDDALPSTMLIDGQMRRRAEYQEKQLTWLTGPDGRDDLEKLEKNLAVLAQAEYLTLMSNRVYGVVPRLPERYDLSSQYHQLLLDGTLGYEPVYINTRMPNILGIHIQPDSFVWPDLLPAPAVASYLDQFGGVNGGRFDESFTVYDQPLVIVFQNVTGKTAEEMGEYFSVK